MEVKSGAGDVYNTPHKGNYHFLSGDTRTVGAAGG